MKNEKARKMDIWLKPTSVTRTGRCLSQVAPVCVLLLTAGQIAKAEPESSIFLRCATLHIGNGEVVSDGAILVRGERIDQVGRGLEAPADAVIIELSDGSITPGFIDANTAIGSVVSNMEPAHDTGSLFHDLIHPTHRHHRGAKGVSCCGSRCPRWIQHVEGSLCSLCGFPNAAPSLAVGVQFAPSMIETSSEVIPHTRIIDSIDLRSPDFERLLSGGVTTVFVSPDPGAVISSQGALIRTGGPMSQRIIREADAVLAVMGTEPSWRGAPNDAPFRQSVSFYARRPTTRMGVAWVFRKAFFDTRKFARGLEIHGADAPSPAAMAVLQKILTGQVRLRIQARMQHDILSALRLAQEFGQSVSLVEATEAHKCLAEIKAVDCPVVYGPIYVTPAGHRRFSGEVDEARLSTFSALLEAGIHTALTANDLRDEDGLARQAMYARRFGIDLANVTRSVTQTPAQLLGLGEDVGTLEPGKRADIVVWNGPPFESTSQAAVVLIGGRVVLDRRPG